jgi:FkbM family methyltransferase
VLVEPNPTAYKRLCELRARDTVVNTAISSSAGVLPFVVDKACSGVLDDNYAYRNRENKEVIDVPCRPLADVLGQYAADVPIAFLSVDCEGHDLAVLKSNDWSRFRPRVVIAEDHEPRYDGPIHEYMVSQGYVYLCKLGPSVVFREQAFVLKVH